MLNIHALVHLYIIVNLNEHIHEVCLLFIDMHVFGLFIRAKEKRNAETETSNKRTTTSTRNSLIYPIKPY